MGQGIPGGLPAAARKFHVVPHYNGYTYFTVESHCDVDRESDGRPRAFLNVKNAKKRAAVLNQGKANG